VADQYVGEIRIFPYNFAPHTWAFCDGALLPLSQNTALFSLLLNNYGGDGTRTFALPDLQGAVPMGWGQGQGLSNRDLGEASGVESVTLLVSEMPVHTHALKASASAADQKLGGPTTVLAVPSGNLYQITTNSNLTQMNFNAAPPSGGGLPHNNMQPYLTLNFCIALTGIFPPR
jgi:microcystin-dependent protein